MSEKASNLGNPGPLGLIAFGMTTILLNLHNAGFFELASVVLAMGIFYGGLAQAIVGVLEFARGNTFGTVAFASYGFFWLTLVAIWVLPKLGLAEATPPEYLAWYLTLWGIFTFFMFFGTLKANKVLPFVFLSLTVLFGLLAAHNFLENHFIGIIAGYVGIVCGASAIYLGLAETLEAQYERKILPF
ncbi:MAG: acetate uptake transporter [Spirochaetia bacterium]|jgi:succinate-acetate transporter protein|nr:acetate uptake transporter [Spirochaetia bacterium]